MEETVTSNTTMTMTMSLSGVVQKDKERRDLLHLIGEEVQRMSVLHRYQLREKQELRKMKEELEVKKMEEQGMKMIIDSFEEQSVVYQEDIQRATTSRKRIEMEYEDYRYLIEEQILENKITLYQALPQFNDNGANNDVRRMGLLSADDLLPLLRRSTVEESSVPMIQNARALVEQWTIEMNELQETELVEEVRRTHGEEIYQKLRRYKLEKRVVGKTGVDLLPWNFEEGREITLSELSENIRAHMADHVGFELLQQEEDED